MKFFLCFLLFFVSTGVWAVESAAGKSQMPVQYIELVKVEGMEVALKEIDLFSDMDSGLVGSPVILLVTFTDKPTEGGAASTMTSGILAASTLGILPIVSNKNITIRYEFLVHKRLVASYEYTKNFTDVDNLYTMKAGELSPKAAAWALSTVDEFKQDIAIDPIVNGIVDEYVFYYQ